MVGLWVIVAGVLGARADYQRADAQFRLAEAEALREETRSRAMFREAAAAGLAHLADFVDSFNAPPTVQAAGSNVVNLTDVPR